MEILSLDEIVKVTCGQIISGDRAAKINGISTDSRTIKSGDLFFALKGERFDGHQFLMHAMNTGAVGAVISNESKIEPGYGNFSIIRVKDTTTALGDLAKYYRQKLSAKIVGITGSNGKTTTKEMTYHLLSQFGSVAKSQKSFNNFIGVPVTIFEIENRHQYGVLEMGTNAPGEIRRLSDIGAPDIAVIVNISKTHLEGLESIEGVAQAKAEILENLRKGGVFVYNADNAWCVKIAGSFKGETVSFGFNSQSHIRCTDVKKKDKGYVLELNEHLKIPLPIPGYHNITNCLASFAICKALGQDISRVKDAFSSFKLPSMRIEQQRIGNITVINDAYNANPESVRAALQYLSEINASGRKIFVCGDMLELGNESALLHREIGETVSRLNIDLLWTVGKCASEIAKAAKSSGTPHGKIISFQDVSDITATEINELRDNDIVLIKGSRGMHMENIIEKFKEFFSKREPVHNCN
ncbi:MAG: UDP-N-acetylmuramoyl-tripeptide--D-alanyl-D-alanine ligase [Planctomycetes bacterium]|nr:UDP-N-acetylmuramoyl-tripeptide--D-alanyl-D-alanine ligase [Planctomycetota bacterium]